MMSLKIPPEQALLLLTERIDAMNTIRAKQCGLEYYSVIGWCSKTYEAIDAIYAADDPRPEEIRSIALSNCSCDSSVKGQILADACRSRLEDYVNEIRELMQAEEEKIPA